MREICLLRGFVLWQMARVRGFNLHLVHAMKTIPFCLGRSLRVSGWFCWLVLLAEAGAFFPTPTSLMLDEGGRGEVKVLGLPASTKISLESVVITPPMGLTSDFTTSPKIGNGVMVAFTAQAPGLYTVDFFGKNQFGMPGQSSVSGSVSVLVLDVPETSAQNPFVALAGDPVNTATGEFFGRESVDLDLGGPMPLRFCRYVASSLSLDDVVQAGLGENRSHNFASRVISTAITIKRVVLPEGRVLRFDKSGSKWLLKSPLDVPYQLVETATELLLGDPHSKQVWTYDKTTGRLARMEDGKGNVHTLTYVAGELISISDGLGRTINISRSNDLISSVTGLTGLESRQVLFGYTSGVLTSSTDAGNDVTTDANTVGRPASFTRPAGNTPFTQSYTDGRVVSQTERGTDTSTLAYGTNSTTFTDPAGETLVDHYDAQGRLISHVDEGGRTISITYDAAGRRHVVTDRLGRKITILYHALSGLPHTIINAEGRSTLFAFKPRTLMGVVFQDLSKITYPDGASRSFSHDARGNVTQITDEAGKNWKYSYNSRGQVLTVTNPLGGVTTNTYDTAGNLVTSQPPDTGITLFSYDGRYRLTQITRPGGATVVLAYDAKDRLTSWTNERGKVWQYAYDANNRLTAITDPDTEVTGMGHDSLDRMTTITDRLSQVSTLTFDSRHLLSSFTDRNGQAVSLGYDERRRLASLEDPSGEEWLFSYDDEGRLLGAQTPLDPASTRTLNALGYPVQLRDALGNTRTLTRDAMQRLLTFCDPVGRQTSYAYDKRGLLISAAEQGTGTVKYDRDALGSIVKISDPGGGAWSMAYQKSGRLIKTTDPLGRSSTLTYDTRGRPATLTYQDGGTCSLTYDASSNLTGAAFSGGPGFAYAYDNLGRLTAADEVAFEYDAEGRITNCPQNTQDYTATYDAAGRLLTVSYHGGLLTVTYGYDSRNLLTSVTDSEGTVISFVYDEAGRLRQQNRTPGVDSTYAYDAAGRLTQMQDGGFINLAYQLNPASEVVDVDMTAPTLPVVVAASEVFKYGKAGEITSPGYVYDKRGRLSASPGRTYQWDAASRLVNANGVALTYNGLGDLVTRTEAAQTTRYYHHYALGLAPIVYEDLPTGPDRFYVWTPGGRLLYSVDSGTGDPTFYHFDRMGSTLALSDKDGVVTDSYAYGPYGEPLGRAGTSTQPFTYIGAFGVRQEGSLYHMRARYYDPGSAHFLSRDPRPPRLIDPKSVNMYAYASQNPLRYLDPRGAAPESGMPVADAGQEGFAMASLFSQIFVGPMALNESTRQDDSLAASGLALFSQTKSPLGEPLMTGPVPGPPSPFHDNVLWGDYFMGSSSPRDLTGGGLGNDLGGMDAEDGFFWETDLSRSLLSELNGDRHSDYFPPNLPMFTDGGMLVENGPFAISNSTISGNAEDGRHVLSSAATTVEAVVVQHFMAVYRALRAAEQALIDEMNRNLRGDEGKVRAFEEIKKQRKAIGKIIKSLGGTPPD